MLHTQGTCGSLLVACTVLLALVATWPPAWARAQCLLANPSFERLESASRVFGGWNQFGVVGSATPAPHGSHGARVTGPDAAGWGVSAFWQRLDATPGATFTVTAHVAHASTAPLTGDSRAIVNIEWRDAADALIEYESFVVADASTTPDQFVSVVRTSGAAPAATVATHVLLGVLQSPHDPAPDVLFDQATFERATTPLPEESQWLDFPGGRVLDFAGFEWRVKGPIVVGGIPYSDATEDIWVDAQGRMHLTLQHRDGTWHNTEVALTEPLGYGDYIFTTQGDLDRLDPHAVLGLFLWQYTDCYLPQDSWWNPNNEIDIEFSRWGDPGAPIAQYVVQPYTVSQNMVNFDIAMEVGERTSHAFRWLRDRIEFRSWRGGPWDESPESLLHSWVYSGNDLPRPEQPRVHLNLRKLTGEPARDQEVVLDGFRFVPDCDGVPCPETASDAAQVARRGRLGAWPNPFNPNTTIGFDMPRGRDARLDVYDVAGRHVRTLARGWFEEGPHTVTWDGTSAPGQHMASGVYVVRLRSGTDVRSRRLVLVR